MLLKYQPVFKSKYCKAETLKKLVPYFVFFNLDIITMRFTSTTPARDGIPARTKPLPGPPLLRKEGKLTRLDISLLRIYQNAKRLVSAVKTNKKIFLLLIFSVL